jgi:hypothetical protein
MVRLHELTRTTISLWNNGHPGFMNVTAMDPDLFKCPHLRMQNAANYECTAEETADARLPAEGWLSLDGRQLGPDFEHPSDAHARPARRKLIVDLPVEHPMFSIPYNVNPLPQIPSLGSWRNSGQDSENGAPVHYFGVFDDHNRLACSSA